MRQAWKVCGALVALLVWGCELDYRMGSRGDGGADGGIFSDGGPYDGGYDGGPQGVDGGLLGDGGPFTFTPLATPFVHGFWSVHGTGPDRVFLASSDRLYHFDGGSWTNVLTVGATPLDAVFATPHEVYVATDQSLFACTQSCGSSSALFVEVDTAPIAIRGFCLGPSQEVYAVGFDVGTSAGAVFRRDNLSWTPVLQASSVKRFHACAADLAGNLFIAGSSSITRYVPADGGVFIEQPDFTPTHHNPEYVQWNALALAGGELFVAGPSRLVMKREATGQWSVAFDPGPDGGLDHLSLTAIGPELFAVGQDEPPAYQWLHFNGHSWNHGHLFQAEVRAVWAASPHELWVVGRSEQLFQGVAYRGHR